MVLYYEIDKYIEKFNKSIIIINNALLTGGTINHNDVELSKVLKEIANNITAEYHKKETAQQNTNIEKEKYKELISIIDKYNKLLNVYNSVRGKNEKTAGDIFRQIGGNTSKKSVKTKTFTKKINELLKEENNNVLSVKEIDKLLQEIADKSK